MREIVQLESSAITQAEFDSEAKTVTVTFASGKQDTVPCTKELFEEFTSAESAGRFWHQRLKQK